MSDKFPFPECCPECGSTEFAFGPPDGSGGERYKISAWYCENCGYVFGVTQWSQKMGIRVAQLMPVDV